MVAMSATRPATRPAARPDLTSASLSACANAVIAAVVGLSIAVIVGVCAWVFAPHAAESGPEVAVRTAAGFWVLAHHVPIELPTGPLGLTPLGLMLIPALLLYVAGRQVARVAKPRRPADLVRFLLPMSLTYALVTAIVAGVAAPEQARSHAWQAFATGFVFCFAFAGIGISRASGLATVLWGRLPLLARESMLGGVVGAMVLVAFGAVITTMALLVGFPEAVEMFRALEPDAFGGVVLAVLCLCFVPNLVVWATAFSTGIGFDLGVSGAVSPRGVDYGALPVFPPLTVIPPEGQPGALAMFTLIVPLVAGVLTGFFLHRRLPDTSPAHLAALAGGSGAGCGVIVGALAWLSAGSVASGEFAAVGPVWWSVGMVAALEVGLVAAVVAWESSRRRWNRPLSRDWAIDLRAQRGRLMGRLRSR